MKLIESITKEQETQLAVYRDKWLAIGLSTERANRAAAERACRDAYKVAGLEGPKFIFWAESPVGLLMTAKLIKELAKKGFEPYKTASNEGDQVGDQVRAQVRAQVRDQVGDQVGDQVWDQVGDQVRAQVRDQVWDQVWDQVGDQVWAQVGDQVWDQVGDQVWAQVGDQVRAQVRDQVRDQVGDQVRAQVRDQVWDQVNSTSLRDEWNECYSWGQHDANWLGFYNFFQEVLGLNFCDKLSPLMTLAKETGWHLFYKDIAILSEKPTEIHRNDQNRLHKDGGPALKWVDGYELFSLNGIRVPKEIALITPDEITRETILKQENADYRREIVRKLSGKQLLEVLDPKVLDEKFGYALLSIDLGDDRQRPFLKMNNPSIDAIHVEGVTPNCRTVEDAIEFRNGRPGFPITLDGFEIFSEEIGDYFQQGDCLFSIEKGIPFGATECAHNIAGEGLIRHIQTGGKLFDHGPDRYLLVDNEASIGHPEHKNTILSGGIYKISKVREYDHWKEESREVID